MDHNDRENPTNNYSVIDVLLGNKSRSTCDFVNDLLSIQSSTNTIVNETSFDCIVAMYIIYGYSVVLPPGESNITYEVHDKINLLIVKSKVFSFHEILGSNSEDKLNSVSTAKLSVNNDILNTESLIVNLKYNLEILIPDIVLIIEFSITIGCNKASFFACLQKNNKYIFWGFNPQDIRVENNNMDLITLDSSNLKDFFDLTVTKYINHEGTITSLNELSTHLVSYLSEYANFNTNTEDFYEILKNLYNYIKANVNSISQLFLKNVNKITASKVANIRKLNGLCVDKCYLDATSVKSILSHSYLDDAIIDFFNEFTQKYILKRYQRKNWVILNTFFLRKILQYEDSKEAYKNTWRWTKKFKRSLSLHDFIFIPMNQHGVHWSLIIIAYPKFAIRNKNKRYDKKASIIYLDSLGISKLDENISEMLKNYLRHEFENKCKELRRNGFEFICNDTAWESVCSSRYTPLQQNGHDCGVYVIEYINHLIVHPSTFKQLIPKYIEDDSWTGNLCCKKWFTQGQINHRRGNMKEMLVFMKNNPEWSFNVDSIEFLMNKMLQNA